MGWTPKTLCEAYVYWRMMENPELQKLGTVEDLAEKFFNASPTGELWHVFEARDWLRERGLLPKED